MHKNQVSITGPSHIFLAGFAGSGKTTVGTLLAKQMRRRFIDLDVSVEHDAGRSIRELIQAKGERYFRQLEAQSLVRSCRQLRYPAVISLGGGTLLSATNRRMVACHGVSVYLKCSRRILVKRLTTSYQRPLFRGARKKSDFEARVKRMLSKRMPGYNRCDYQVTVTNLTPMTSVRKICELLG